MAQYQLKQSKLNGRQRNTEDFLQWCGWL